MKFLKFSLNLNFLRWFYRYQFAQNPAQNGLILELKLFSFDTDKIIIWYLLYIIIKLFYSNMTLNEINYRFKIKFSIFAQSKWTVHKVEVTKIGRSFIKLLKSGGQSSNWTVLMMETGWSFEKIIGPKGPKG